MGTIQAHPTDRRYEILRQDSSGRSAIIERRDVGNEYSYYAIVATCDEQDARRLVDGLNGGDA